MSCPHARCSDDLWDQGGRTRRLLASFHLEMTCPAFSGSCVVFSQLPHTQNPHAVIQQHTGIWSTTLWIGKLHLVFCHQETTFDIISQKSDHKKSRCETKRHDYSKSRARTTSAGHKTRCYWCEGMKIMSSKHWKDTIKARSIAFTDICKPRQKCHRWWFIGIKNILS